MPDLLSTGLSGLLAFRRALDTTGHNIANANTEGYNRQRVELVALEPSPFGNGYVGNGVRVATVQRSYDAFLVSQARVSSSTLARLETFATQAERLNNLFSDADNGLSVSLQKFHDALQSVASTPGSLAARQVLLGEMRAVADRLRYFDARLRDVDADIDGRLAIEIASIGSLAENIARLNGQISRGFAATNQPPKDLLDQRDRLIDQLSAKLNVQVVPQDAGTVNIFVG
ncbi:MAG: flagellar hook-associated protein FlgK, partial [Steroidobacteraceae bacterium]|nr:flagellar hook-associated protein FlgK [Steroidobacteraceae bacterium]